MERDLIGYGITIPKVNWPNNARIAVSFIINYEEGAESNILDGDDCSENYLTDLPSLIALRGERNLSSESLFEYGSRAGIWRLLHLFEEFGISLTFFASGLALERNPVLAETLKDSHHEIAGHGYRWINYRYTPEVVEYKHITRTIDTIQKLTQKKVKGWYTGRRSCNTRQLIVEAGLAYDCDSYADDLPYWTKVLERNHLIIPYNIDANDARYALSPGWNNGDAFLSYLRDTFDCLYREGTTQPKVMTIGLHTRLSGRPGRCEALRKFIQYIKSHELVWICRREEISDYWYKNYPME